ncbi:MAG TPA: pyridine nucleotide-disulfide oxidoreductase, partial [Chitinophagaceae bacterium]|nr:pyridine nucleotide-disulfide oxidoreductase [Chitinophagaceae bacterium]
VAAKKDHKHYVGVKYHAPLDFSPDTIALHMFRDGYCGIVRIEDGKYNVCYLTTASNLRQSGNSIEKMEASILSENPHLKKIFSQTGTWRSEPVTSSQISFANKTQVDNHILMVGDAAGMITPLCGNGMSMAFHGSKIAATLIDEFLKDRITREALEKNYETQWQRQFGRRLRTGRQIQHLAGLPRLTAAVLQIGRLFPGLFQILIRKTHGKPF